MLSVAAARVVVANTLGYLSIVCWLCAQFPQVLKNIQLQSCEGLALPFLCNWLFGTPLSRRITHTPVLIPGDVTNLIGCVLTDQLPFQTYLAAYFCVVDFALVVQYFHYRRPAGTSVRSPAIYAHPHPSPAVPHLPSTVAGPPPPLPRSRSTTHPPTSAPYRSQRRRGGPLASPALAYGSGADALALPSPALDPHNEYDALYAAALGVARAAERVHRRSQSGKRRAAAAETDAAADDDHDHDAAAAEGMLASYHSEMSAASSSTGTAEAPEMAASTASLYDARGRARGRAHPQREGAHAADGRDTVDGLPREGGRGVVVGQRSKSRSQSLARARGSGRRAAGVAFMSFGVLAGVSRIAGHGVRVAAPSASGSAGVVLTPPAQPWPSRHPLPPVPYLQRYDAAYTHVDVPDPAPEPFPGHTEPPPTESTERIVGRVSAWCCTTLYLTSRLPQIWKNFQRRSVEGLSILLFVFAFCGNLTYVVSILLNPAGSADPSEAGHYLFEALPYLLGSGGTLIFDLAIMVQSVIYGSAPPVPPSPMAYDRGPRRRTRPRLRTGDSTLADVERRPLLDGLERETSMRGGARGASRPRVKSAPALGNGAFAAVRRASGSPVRARSGVALADGHA
ncbi:hypothetical protein Q5752_001574 [Cryptotrichosporon argae]